MKARLGLPFLILVSGFLLSACDVSIGPSGGCANPFICDDEGTGVVNQQLKALISRTGFDAANVSLDYSSGNVSVTQSSGYVSLSLFLEGGTELNNSFPWTRQGQEIVFANPSSVNAWVDPHLAQLSGFEYDLNNLSVQSQAGVNVFASEVKYSNQVLAGYTDSYYIGGGWCDPATGICFDPE